MKFSPFSCFINSTSHSFTSLFFEALPFFNDFALFCFTNSVIDRQSIMENLNCNKMSRFRTHVYLRLTRSFCFSLDCRVIYLLHFCLHFFFLSSSLLRSLSISNSPRQSYKTNQSVVSRVFRKAVEDVESYVAEVL